MKTVVRQKQLALKKQNTITEKNNTRMQPAQKMDIGFSVCQVCNDKKKEEIVAKGHSKGIRNKATATCKAEG